MRAIIRRQGTRAPTDPSDAEVWLRLFQTAITAGKTFAEAIAITDAGATAFRKRFAAAPQATSSPGPQASGLPK